jgi:hypothetical protein
VTDPETKTAAELGITQDLNGNGVIGEEDLELIFDFEPDGPERNWNNFEGSIEVAGRYYAVWPSLSADSAWGLYQLVLDPPDPPPPAPRVRSAQRWVYKGYQWVGILDEVPPPHHCP